jgi:hypothetical protein
MLNLAWAKTFLALVETKSFHTRTTPSSSSSLRVSVATRGRLGQLQLSGGGLASLALGLRTDAGRFCLHALRDKPHPHQRTRPIGGADRPDTRWREFEYRDLYLATLCAAISARP